MNGLDGRRPQRDNAAVAVGPPSGDNLMTRTVAVLAAVAVAGALAGGYFLAGRTNSRDSDDHLSKPFVEVSYRWSLLPADAKSDRDPPVVAVDARGRVLVAWSSQTGETERTLFLA